MGDDSFTSYAKDSNAAKLDFDNYGKLFNEGTDTLTGYAKGTAKNQEIGFKIYGVDNTFKDYAKNGVSFSPDENSTMGGLMADTLAECERKPTRGKMKWYVDSIEDMINFAALILGRNIAVRTTKSTEGSKKNVMIGSIKGISGGKVTKSISYHQSLYPYLLYYCHSVPKVQVYDANLLNSKTKSKINHGIAICHMDTSDWSATHWAFLTLGSAPGKIEICHWI